MDVAVKAKAFQPEVIILEILRKLTDRDIRIENLKQNGSQWQAEGEIDKFHGGVKMHFSFSFGK